VAIADAPFPSGNDVVLWTTILRGDKAGSLADLVSISDDIEFARNALIRLASLSDVQEEGFDLLLERALWNAAHVALARPFTGGKGFLRPGAPRTRLDGLRADLSAEEESVLVQALDVRDQHVAHSVNAYECVTVFADFLPPELGGGWQGVGVVHETQNSARKRIPALVALADRLLGLLGVEQERAHDDVLADVRSREDDVRAQASRCPTVDARDSRR
jgi:hypothetical protein